MKNYKISEDVLKGIINYLATRPYGEVVAGIQELQSLKPIENKKDEEIPA